MSGAQTGNVFLIGPMGSGKTTIGRRTARRLGLEFHDCDRDLEAHTGASVNLIFDIEGEEGFRRRESAMLDDLAQREGVLLATGGGVVMREENRRVLSERGLVVYLQTSVDQQLERLQRDTTRPLLNAPDRRERLEALARVRNPLYEELADIVFPARDRSVAWMARQLADTIRAHREATTGERA
ncbi:MAG: shikimate kinase AroK [Xanthomonadales bacterium]|nr:shikimate kinase AroK [Xanthomonadales bacterium]